MLGLDTQPPEATGAPSLRFYQREAVDRTVAELDAGRLNTLCVIATGGGKTNVGLEFLHEDCLARRRGRALWIAHRSELIQQPLARMLSLHPEHAGRLGVVMGERNEPTADLVVATVQSITSPRRLRAALAVGPFTHLVTDECHHAVSSTYRDLLRDLRAAYPQLRHVGYTATPIRSDGDGLSKVFDSVAYKATMKDLSGWGFLVPIKAFSVETLLRVEGVKVSRTTGDFQQAQLARVTDVDNCFELVVKTHTERTPGKRAICFTASVKGAHALAKAFRAHGVSAASVDGETPKPVRDGILRRFRQGDIEVLTNCAVWTEGLDLPELEVAHMVAPCASDLTYMQKMGRVVRTYPGKEHAVVFDYVPLDARNLVLAGDVLGKPLVQRKQEDRAKKAGTIIDGFSWTGTGTGLDGDPEALFTRPLDFLTASPYSWFVSGGLATLNLGSRGPATSRILVISRPAADGQHKLAVLEQHAGLAQPYVVVLGRAPTDEYARLAEAGQEYALANADPRLAGKKAAWQTRPITPRQTGLLRQLLGHLGAVEVDAERIETLSSREAAQLITHAMARRALAAHARRRPIAVA